MKNLSLAVLMFIWPLSLNNRVDHSRRLIIWNVGQGFWATVKTEKLCIHFDSGGEHFPKSQFLNSCKLKQNHHYISHLDWDHISFFNRLNNSHKPCRVGLPKDRRSSFLYKNYKNAPECLQPSSFVKEIPTAPVASDPNDLSRIFSFKNWALFPGDSTKRQERHWANWVPREIRVLALGHHGSYTSTGESLLKSLPQLSLAIVSARKSKYGHPHITVLKRLKKYGIPVLNTEDWGHIILETP